MATVHVPRKRKIAVIDEGLVLELEAAHMLSPPSEGMRTISSSSYSSTNSNASFEIPDDLYSTEMFIFLGFRRQAAGTLFHRWYNGNEREDDIADPIPYVKAYLREFPEVSTRDRPEVWSTLMQRIGIQDPLINAILNPYFEDLRNTKTAREWLLDTFDTRYGFLMALNKILAARKRADLELRSETPEGPPSRAIRPSAQQQAHEEGAEPAIRVTDAQLRSLSGHTLLYKGGDWERFKPAFKPDGRYDFGELLSSNPTDFHPRAGLLYLTKQREVAQHYANYASDRSPNHRMAILTFAIPNAFLSNPCYLWNHESPTWRKLVHASRTRNIPPPRLPSDLRWTEGQDLKVGNVCGQSSRDLLGIAERDIVALRLLGQSVSQHCFTDNLYSRMEAVLKDKVAVQFIAARRPE